MNRWCLMGACLLWVLLVGARIQLNHRYRPEIKTKQESKKIFLSLSYDPRGIDAVDKLVLRRESDNFRERSISGRDMAFGWPGLSAMQVSWTWLELLQGLHIESASKGDYSWMFSKLNSVAQNSSSKEIEFLTALAPFYFVIGTDYVGANHLVNEMIKRGPDRWRTWFWSGFHAMENLNDRKWAGDLMAHAAQIPGAPHYSAVLSLILSRGKGELEEQAKAGLLEKDLPPELLEKVKIIKPQWFGK